MELLRDTVIPVLISGVVLIPPLVLIYWCWTGRFRPEFAHGGYPRGWFAVSLLSAVGFTWILAEGLKASLLIIPSSWGGVNEDGEFVSARESLGLLIGSCASFGVLCLLIQWGGRPKK